MSSISTEMESAPSSFSALLDSFATFAGVTANNKHAMGLEFEAGHYTVRALPHPEQPDWLIVEVDVIQTANSPSPAREALHRINHTARLAHGWMATLDGDGLLVMHTLRPIASVTAADLEGLLVEGIDRAEVLANLWIDFDKANTQGHGPATPAADEWLSLNSVIRG